MRYDVNTPFCEGQLALAMAVDIIYNLTFQMKKLKAKYEKVSGEPVSRPPQICDPSGLCAFLQLL